MNTEEFFTGFWDKVKETPHWKAMATTVEGSEWHREANVAVHTTMCIEQYMSRFFAQRTESERMISLMALLFHDFGKPEAEETLPNKDGSPGTYHRYAGHEPISGNEFINFMMDHDELRESFLAQGYTYEHIRKIKVMIEHHLPYSLKKSEKRAALREMLALTLHEHEECFYDMLRCDSAGRISDNHAEKLANVETWITEFQAVNWQPSITRRQLKTTGPTLTLVVGVSGVGKSTWIREHGGDALVFSEDDLRYEYAREHFDDMDLSDWPRLTSAEQYNAVWEFCHLNKLSKYDAFMKARWNLALSSGRNIILDRMNQGKKSRGWFINTAKEKGYKVESVEFMASESLAQSRQLSRQDKRVPEYRVHQIVMQLETPWFGPEVDSFKIVPCI